jgi:predicted nuclease with TOPRIM domain
VYEDEEEDNDPCADIRRDREQLHSTLRQVRAERDKLRQELAARENAENDNDELLESLLANLDHVEANMPRIRAAVGDRADILAHIDRIAELINDIRCAWRATYSRKGQS